jgi:PhnB protein
MAKIKYKAPKGYGDATAYLRIDNAAAAIDFYAAAFDAKEKYRLAMGDRVGHAELDFGSTRVMLSDEFPDMKIVGPKKLGGVSSLLCLHVADADAVFERAIAAGATVKRPLTDEFYGYRSGQLEDPFGHVWMIQTLIEEVSPKKMQKRLDAMLAQQSSQQAAEPQTTPKKAAAKNRPAPKGKR